MKIKFSNRANEHIIRCAIAFFLTLLFVTNSNNAPLINIILDSDFFKIVVKIFVFLIIFYLAYGKFWTLPTKKEKG
jgi:hypothetical protein